MTEKTTQGRVGRPRVHSDDEARRQAHEARRRAKGLVRATVVVPAERLTDIREIAERMRKSRPAD